MTDKRKNATAAGEVRFLESRYATKSLLCNLKEAAKTALFRIAMGVLGQSRKLFLSSLLSMF